MVRKFCLCKFCGPSPWRREASAPGLKLMDRQINEDYCVSPASASWASGRAVQAFPALRLMHVASCHTEI